MTEAMDRYLTQAYRRDILGESVGIEMPAPDPELIATVKREITRIDELRLGASLASRDFVAYQNKRALVRLLEQLERNKGPSPQPSPTKEG